MDAKHTTGTWETGAVMTNVEHRPEGWNVPILIADCHPKHHAPESPEERVSNARLIAAAPDLLEACEAAEQLLAAAQEHDPTWGLDTRVDGVRDIARAAITKAKGE